MENGLGEAGREAGRLQQQANQTVIVILTKVLTVDGKKRTSGKRMNWKQQNLATD